MKRELGILALLVTIIVITTIDAPRFLLEFNLENLLERTTVFAILAIGVAFVIITGGIDLSIGSVVGLVGALMPVLLFDAGWSVGATMTFVLGMSLGIGLLHGLLITKVGLQPFVVTLCGLLVYRGGAMWVTGDITRGFGSSLDAGLRQLATARPFSLPLPGIRWISEGNWSSVAVDFETGEPVFRETDLFFGGAVQHWSLAAESEPVALPFWGEVPVPLPFLVLLLVGVMAWVFLERTIWGRYLLALGRSEEAARYSGIKTDGMVITSYVVCSGLAGLGGVLFSLEVNSIQPGSHGSFFELYAIAGAVLGGCSLRGGEGSIPGVMIGAAVMPLLYNMCNLMGIPTELEVAITGMVILAGVVTDTLVKRVVARRRRGR